MYQQSPEIVSLLEQEKQKDETRAKEDSGKETKTLSTLPTPSSLPVSQLDPPKFSQEEEEEKEKTVPPQFLGARVLVPSSVPNIQSRAFDPSLFRNVHALYPSILISDSSHLYPSLSESLRYTTKKHPRPKASDKLKNRLVPTVKPKTDRCWKLVTWNVDGLVTQKQGPDCSHVWKWIKEFLQDKKPDVLGLQEIKSSREQVETLFKEVEKDYSWIIQAHEPYSSHGVAMLIRKDIPYESLVVNLDCLPRHDTRSKDPACGRVIGVCLGNRLNIVCTYVPNSGCGSIPLKNIDYRVKHWDPALYKYLNQVGEYIPTVWMGDLNVAPEDDDVIFPERMNSMAGFTPEERDNFRQFCSASSFSKRWFDVWRWANPHKKQYTCWFFNRLGRRLDHFVVNSTLLSKLRSCSILDNRGPKGSTPLSDHLPVQLILDPSRLSIQPFS